ncbi:hypothetical protein Poli38472_006789 [Pythium oligandrum]|uniref:Uncharacterized protein n=1 Tax=Pythium oligandrum TaxID=41045 RepID=A0A8K1C5E4_PYTOL|nr:hypothetical protein Poli38472_006789 [Pythium oligandrum]|eukprot:TMW56779.1 hypothetical protein Poli38472_006789 [Pythium oligandrum]
MPHELSLSPPATKRVRRESQHQEGDAKAPRRRKPRLVWRTRDSERSKEYNLTLDVNNVKQEIHDLQMMRDLLFARQLNRPDTNDGSCVKVVRQYYHALRYGYQDSKFDMLAFFRSVVDEYVRLGRFVGIKQLIEMSQRYKMICSPMHMTFKHAEVIPQDTTPGSSPEVVVVATFSYAGTVTELGAQRVFPSLLTNPDLMKRLIGQQVGGMGKAHFIVDPTTLRIVGYVFDLNLPAAFLRLLKNVKKVARVLDGSRFTPEYYIGEVSNPVQEPLNDEIASKLPLPEADPATTAWKMSMNTLLSSEDDDQEPEQETS